MDSGILANVWAKSKSWKKLDLEWPDKDGGIQQAPILKA